MINLVEKTKKYYKKYYKSYGYRGLFVAAKSKFLTKPIKAKVKPPRISCPFFLRVNTSDIPTYHQVFINSDYECEISKYPKVIIDAGANVGFASIFFANRYPESKVLSIEPELSNFTLLKHNVMPYPNVVPIRAALWKDNADVEIIDPGLGHWGFQTKDSGKILSEPLLGKVPGITVDKIMMDYHVEYVDILKIDIEGAEKEVFENVSKWINMVGVMIIELHDRLRPGCSQIFYNATINFDFEFKRGENIFLARKDYVPDKRLKMDWQIRCAPVPTTYENVKLIS